MDMHYKSIYILESKPSKHELQYEFVDNETPELGIAILLDYRQHGIGALLMKEIR
jgi:hypothetical protein